MISARPCPRATLLRVEIGATYEFICTVSGHVHDICKREPAPAAHRCVRTLSETAVSSLPGRVVVPSCVTPKAPLSTHDTASKKLLWGLRSDI